MCLMMPDLKAQGSLGPETPVANITTKHSNELRYANSYPGCNGNFTNTRQTQEHWQRLITNQLKISVQENHCSSLEDMRFHFSIPRDTDQAGSSNRTVKGGPVTSTQP